MCEPDNNFSLNLRHGAPSFPPVSRRPARAARTETLVRRLLPSLLLLLSSRPLPARAAGQSPCGAGTGRPYFPRREEPGAAATPLAAVHLGGGRRGLAWRRPARCARGNLTHVEAATGGRARGCCGHGGGGGSNRPAQILAGGGGSARRRRGSPATATARTGTARCLDGCGWRWPAMAEPGLGPDLGPLGLDRVG
jgi:hypothetical protein